MADQLVINGRHANTGFAGGVVRYTTEVARALDGAVIVSPPASMASGPVGHLWEQTVLPAKTRRDVLFSPANFGPLAHSRHVVTIHDLSPLDHPEWFAPSYVRLFSAIVPRLARRAQAVITDSEFSRSRIAEHCGVESTVAGVGVGSPFIDVPDQDRGQRVVVVGGRDPRKNVESILRSWPLVLEDLPGAEHILIGGSRSSWVFGSEPEAAELPPNVVVYDDVSDREMADLLSGAGAAVFCSLYEGFGLPVLEALATGTPVVCSDIAPLREFADGVATFVDPRSARSIARGVIATLNDPPTSAETARDVASQHSWARVASNIQAVVDTL